MKVIGKKDYQFQAENGTTYTGMTFHCTEPLEGGEGEIGFKVSLSDAKYAQLGYVPAIGDEVTVLYNRYGKADAFIKQK